MICRILVTTITYFLHCVFPNASSDHQPDQMTCHIDCICAPFVHCEPADVFSGCQLHQMICCIGYICATFLHCERLGASSGCQPNQMISCIAHIYAPFLRYELKDVSWSNDISHCAQLWTFSPLCEREDESSDYQLVQMIFHIEHICAPFLCCELADAS